MIKIEDFFVPAFIGNVSSSGSAACFGWATGHDQELVALSVMGGTTTIESIWANSVLGSSLYLSRPDDDTGPWWSSKYAYTQGHKFSKHQAAVPNSSYVSLILINRILEEYVPTARYLYLPNLADLEERFFRRLKQICLLPVYRSWVPYLLRKGKGDLSNKGYTFGQTKRLCGVMSTEVESWQVKSFNLFWLANDKQQWEMLITTGLKAKEISIDDDEKGM